MLIQLKWPLLEQQRNFLKLIMFYKILHGIVDTTIILTPLSTSTRGHSQRFVTPFARTDTYLNSFIPSTNLWNSLPDSLVNLDDINKLYPYISSLQINSTYNYLCVYTLFVSFYTVNNK